MRVDAGRPGRPPRLAPGVWTIALAIAIVGFCIWSVQGEAVVSCEVCVRFRSVEACRRASAADRALAVRAAEDAACGVVGKGLPERMQCGANPPTRVTCEERR
jgi:hypothetical protein